MRRDNILVKYTAVNIAGQKLEGQLQINDIDKLSNSLRQKGYFITKYSSSSNRLLKAFQRKANLKDLSIICNSLNVLLKTGMNIIEVIKIIYVNCNKKVIKSSLNNIYLGLSEGKSIYESMKKFQDIYPYFMTEMIGVGERSGQLENICKKLSEYYEKQYKIYMNVKSSLMYPFMIFIISIFMIIFITNNIIPQFISTLNDVGGNVPLFTSITLGLLNAIKKHFLVINVTFFSGIFLFSKYISSSYGREKWDKFKLNIPVIRNIYTKFLISKFSLAMSILISSGCNIISSLEKSVNVIDNKFMEKKIVKSIQHIKAGRSIYDAFKCEVEDLSFLYAVRIGEEGGNLDDMLLKLGEGFQRDVEFKLKKLVKFIEPMCILILAVFIGGFVISALLPIVNIMDSIN